MVLLDVWCKKPQSRRLCLANSTSSNVPAGVCVMAIVLFFTKTVKKLDANRKLPLAEKVRRMDLPGLVIFLGAVTCLLLALTWGGQRYAWKSQQMIGLLVGSGLLTIAFCIWIVRIGEYALIPLRVLGKRSIYVGAIVSACFGLLSNVVSFFFDHKQFGPSCDN